MSESSRMRILQVTPTFAPCVGGSERLLQAVSERLVARGHEVTVLAFDCATQDGLYGSTGSGLPVQELQNGVRILRVSPSGGRLHQLHQWWLNRRGGWRSSTWLMGKEFQFQFGRPSGFGMIWPVLRHKADVISTVNWHYGAAYWTLGSSRLRDIPHVAVPLLHIDREWAQREVYARMLRHCAAGIALTEPEAEFLRARGAKSVAVSGGGVEPNRFQQHDGGAIRARYSLADRPIVGFVGRQDELKGVVTLLEAMQVVWRQRPNAVLLLAGPKAHRDHAVTGKIHSLSPAERANLVLLDDFSDQDLPAILGACDVLAQPSLEEAFGLVLIEAWICERAVIGADITATRCLVEPGVDGWLVRPADPGDLAEKILDLLGNPERRAAFGRHGRAKVLGRYTWDRVTDVWERTFRSALHGSPNRT